ncbi:hypothetical protein K435DRAFT_789062 [Dendrothele bispora CBS 962.96]|uniref:Uncharacterized protein n=1 Tax=Dendrothele bispora (strain CBS 962.96) TaxID=1314807 RepID=A0A4S8MVD1_DENBC|nr:hypothetical protein K435DRAFT_789062 [Dendrothele bispora CBS 962.96]
MWSSYQTLPPPLPSLEAIPQALPYLEERDCALYISITRNEEIESVAHLCFVVSKTERREKVTGHPKPNQCSYKIHCPSYDLRCMTAIPKTRLLSVHKTFPLRSGADLLENGLAEQVEEKLEWPIVLNSWKWLMSHCCGQVPARISSSNANGIRVHDPPDRCAVEVEHEEIE